MALTINLKSVTQLVSSRTELKEDDMIFGHEKCITRLSSVHDSHFETDFHYKYIENSKPGSV